MTSPGLRPLAILFVALALSIGWGVRGNWGHEYGAMIPGALAAMAAVLVSAREDWHRRVAYFAFFGALGWSFGGQISYMIVISYTHSGHYPSTLYGFAGLFVIGFLWGAMGGAGTTLPAVASRERLTALFPPILWVFAAWCVEDLLFYWADHAMQPAPGDASWRAWLLTRLDYDRALDWYDTDWFSAVFALLAVALPAAIGRGSWRSWQFWGSILAGALVGHIIVAYLGWQLPRPYRPACWQSFNWGALVGGTLAGVGYLQWTRRFSAAAELVVFMGAGWLAGLILLVEVLGLRMTPPRGDSWAGALGMTVGMFAWLARHNLPLVAWGGIIGGLASGLGFAGAALIKLCAMTTGWQTNWHSVLEQTYGFISGVGIALLLGYLSTRAPRVADDPPVRRWTEPVAIFFTLLAITYLNIRKNLWTVWLKNSDNPGVPPFLPDEMLGISTMTWFHLGYAALAAAVVVPVLRHYLGRRVALFETSWLARGQLLFLVLLWWIVVGNLTRLVPFHPQRMVTEGVIHFNACLCTLLALVLPRRGESLARWALPNVEGLKVRSWFAVFASALVFSVVASLVVRAIYLDRHAGQSNLHIRFGPNNTNAKVWTEEEKNCHGRRP